MSARGDPAPADPDRDDSWAHWRSLKYFALARIVVASVLLAGHLATSLRHDRKIA